jgi:8-oxo-dGTP pyrophosphatase MutT (NUDIX family)
MFCEKCGTPLENNKCGKCGFEKFINPIPVAVALIPVIKDNKTYLLGVRRNINPKKGEIALPGGFQEIETINEAIIREVHEECGIKITVDESKSPQVYSSEPTPNRLLVFIQAHPIQYNDIDWNFKNEETQELVLISRKLNLAFPLHTKAMINYFSKISE